ncbi:MAG: peptidylprolyl isomerase [Parcubacteria group bacterium CG10_big_fil_rev_8_21_14_0_10_41_35]|nr:MAG: peptidylprolyl isomerase [Parcubacteria group bacterium CG10_big_fil_rev_8_21_14_0_10_41_35]
MTLKTNMGDIKIELFLEKMPITAGNFLKLAKANFYDGVTFHRVIPDFMIQGGDPLSKDDDPNNDGTGGPGYFIEDEFSADFTNERGTLSMANAGAGTGGSQFFVNIADNSYLDFNKEPVAYKHPVFGRVLEGMDIVDAISAVERDGHDRPLENVVIQDVLVE